MRLPRIEQTLECCERHLADSSAFGSEIESLLTQSLLVIMCAEFEQEIKAAVKQKCTIVSDEALREFVGSCLGAVFRSVKSGEIAGLLNRFGPTYKESFQSQMATQQQAETFYNNIVTNRHQVAHVQGSNVTFLELKRFYEEGHVVLDCFRDALAGS